MGYSTWITQHTKPLALRPIQRTKQGSLLENTNAMTGARTHTRQTVILIYKSTQEAKFKVHGK